MRLLSAFILTCLILGSPASVEEDVLSCPAVPDFSSFFPRVPDLGRRLRLACPCIGIDGCGHALKSMGCPSDVLNAYDLEGTYYDALKKHFQEMGMEIMDLHLGEVGNLLDVDFRNLRRPIDFLVSGPPCPPWSGQGKHKGCKDVRAKVFMAVVTWIVFLIHCGGLLGCVLENVVGMTHETEDGHEPPSEKFLRVLRRYCPEFDWRLDRLELVKYLLPQTRVRIFFRGMRKVVVSLVPPPLAPFGSRQLHEALGKSPNMKRSDLTLPQQDNLKNFEKEIKAKVAANKLSLNDVVVCPVDRSKDEDITYGSGYTVNNAPTLTTHNVYLVIISVGCVVANVADEMRLFFRFFTLPERLALQGFPPQLALDLPETKICFASGNAYPVPLLVAVLCPMLHAVASSEQVDFASWPGNEMSSQIEPRLIPTVLRALASPGRVVNRGKHERAMMLNKRKNLRKRGRSQSS
jgi:site-specific DNA-cytosine methylase